MCLITGLNEPRRNSQFEIQLHPLTDSSFKHVSSNAISIEEMQTRLIDINHHSENFFLYRRYYLFEFSILKWIIKIIPDNIIFENQKFISKVGKKKLC